MSMPIIQTPRCPISREQAITDILESIALEQTALSHIINAEGEKIQSFLTPCVTPHEMLKVNESVKETLNVITRLENLLQAKLEIVTDKKCKYEYPSE